MESTLIMVPLTSGALSSTGEFSKLPVVVRLDFGRTGLSSRDGEQCSLPVEQNMAIFFNLVCLLERDITWPMF